MILINSTVVAFQLTAPIRAFHDQRQLYHALQMSAPAFSYWRGLFSDPWVPVLALILLGGIVAEVRRNVVSPILNLGPFALWLVLALRDHFYGRQLLLILPLVAIIGVDLAFYLSAFRGATTITSTE